jgi:hypothetical protein
VEVKKRHRGNDRQNGSDGWYTVGNFSLRSEVMNRATFLFGAVVIALAMTSVAHAVVVTNTSTSTTMFDWDFENPSASVGTGTLVSAGAMIVDPSVADGFSAYQGSNVLKVVRDATHADGGQMSAEFSSTPGAGDTLTLDFAFRPASDATYTNTDMALELYSPAGRMGLFDLYGQYGVGAGGAVTAYKVVGHGTGGYTLAQESFPNAWNTVHLSHVNGTADWTIKVNDQTAETVTFQTATYYPGLTGEWNALAMFSNDSSTKFYVDSSAVPEPSSLLLLTSGLIGLLCYAWRKRK